MIVCSDCQRENLEDARFCRGCGDALAVECPGCGRKLTAEARFCDACGNPLARVAISAHEHPRQRKLRSGPFPKSFKEGRYVVKDYLGGGSAKEVYLTHDTVVGRDVAFALIQTDRGGQLADSQRILREAQTMGKLKEHPNIVQLYDMGDDGGRSYMVLPVMEGGDVAQLVKGAPNQTIPLERSVAIAKDVCRGLGFAHAAGVVHRDLKPANVWLDADGKAKIGDFGLALILDRSRLTQEDMMLGTVTYMSPEQAMGGKVDSRSDLYSFGCMLYEMVSGRPPFVGDDSVSILSQQVNATPVAPTWHNKECPEVLSSLTLRLLAKDPDNRPDSADGVLAVLEAIDVAAGGNPAVSSTEPNVLQGLAEGIFVGRQIERDRLHAEFEYAVSGEARLVMLSGELGVGKTHLSQELATYAGLRGAKVLWSRCHEEQVTPPYWPWIQAIRTYARGRDPDELRSELGSGAADIAMVVPELRDRIPGIMDPPPLDDPDEMRFRLFDSVASFLKSASHHQPLVLILDDLQWADRPTLLLLQFLTTELGDSRTMLVGIYRDSELSRRHPLAIALGDLRRYRGFRNLRLQGFTQQDVERFIQLTSGVPPPVALVEAVHEHTEGNPFFVNEVVNLLVQEGQIQTRGQSQESQRNGKDSWSTSIPDGVREVVGRRLSQLSENANSVLSLASLLGQDFTLNVLLRIADDLSDDEVVEALEEAMAAKVIDQHPDDAGLYHFPHRLVRNTLNEEMPTTSRVRLHARIVHGLEEFYGVNAEEHAAELVRHCAEAEPLLGPGKLVQYSLVAGEAALGKYAHEDAVRYFEGALAAKEGQAPDADEARLWFGLGCAQESVGQGSEAWSCLRRAFEYYYEVGDSAAAIAVAQYPLSVPPSVSFGTEELTDLVERALTLVPRESLEAARLLSRYGLLLHHQTSDYDRSMGTLQQALTIARRESDTALEVRILADAAYVDRFHLRWKGV